MRQFKLVNASGTTFDLMRKDAFFHAPDGLGYNRSFDFIQAGYSFLQEDENLAQKSPSGEMVFSGYKQYQEFVSFVTNDPLYLYYKPINRWYRLPCKVQSLGKSEISTSRVLICPITFVALGTWHELVTVTQTDISTTAGKIYNYEYPYIYADTTLAEAAIANGSIESPVKIHIFGAVTNPSWSLIQGGKVISTGRVNATIPDGHKLVINADPLQMEIAEYTLNNEFVQNRYADSDFSTARFIYAPPGNSILSVTGSAGEDVTAFAEVERLAFSV